jgi:hypothetical protein
VERLWRSIEKLKTFYLTDLLRYLGAGGYSFLEVRRQQATHRSVSNAFVRRVLAIFISPIAH